jgi:hypothetical protein
VTAVLGDAHAQIILGVGTSHTPLLALDSGLWET